MANPLDGPNDDLPTIAAIRAIDERDKGLVELEITVSCSPESLWKDRPGHHPWFMRLYVSVLRIRGSGTVGVHGPDGRMRIAVPRGEIEEFIRAVRQVARDTNADYQVFLAKQREQAQREAQGEPAKRARLAEYQARIDAVLRRAE